MKGLMCTTGNCEHNRNCRCLAGPKQNGAAIEAAIDFEYGYSPDVLVKCECADCTYNRNRVCSCESIDVGDALVRTHCFTKRTD